MRRIIASILLLIASLGLQAQTLPLGPVSNVVNFGADPTGVRDSTPAFKAAAAAKVNNQYTCIMMPPGFYRLTDNIALQGPGQCMFGYGSSMSVIKIDSDFNPAATGVISYNVAGGTVLGEWGLWDFGITGNQPKAYATTTNASSALGANTISVASTAGMAVGYYVYQDIQNITFTASVGGATSGTLTQPVKNETYAATFSDSEVRTITVTGNTAATWVGALNAGTITTASLDEGGAYQGLQIPPFTTITQINGNVLTLSAVTSGYVASGDHIIGSVARAMIAPLGSCTTVAGGTGCQYPPFIESHQTSARPHFRNLNLAGAWNCIDFTNNGQVINMSPNVRGIECGGLNIGFQLDGALDWSHIINWHHWTFGWPGDKYSSAWADQHTIALKIGRTDGLEVTDLAMLKSQLWLTSNHGKSCCTSQWTNISQDGYGGAGIKIDGGAEDEFVNLHKSAYSTTSDCPIQINGGTTSFINWWQNNTPYTTTSGMVCITGGEATFAFGEIREDSATNSGPPTFYQTGGTLHVLMNRFSVPAINAVNPVINTTGGVVDVRGNYWNSQGATGVAVSISNDNAGNIVAYNDFQQYTFAVPGTLGSYGSNFGVGLTSYKVLCQTAAATPVTHTGDQLETNLAACKVPAGSVGANGSLRVCERWYRNATTTNAVAFNVRLANSSGAVSGGANASSGDSVSGDVSFNACYTIQNTGATNSQLITLPLNSLSIGGSNSAPSTSGFDLLNNDVYLNFNCKMNTSNSDTCGIYSYTVEALNP